jgi:hypothetical protein
MYPASLQQRKIISFIFNFSVPSLEMLMWCTDMNVVLAELICLGCMLVSVVSEQPLGRVLRCCSSYSDIGVYVYLRYFAPFSPLVIFVILHDT